SFDHQQLSVIPLEEVIPDLLEIEWKQGASTEPISQQLLAILALDPSFHSLHDISAIVGLSDIAVKEILSTIPFIEMEPDGSDIRFVSEPFRRFAVRRLSSLKRTVDDLLVNYLLSQQDREQANESLPIYLFRAGRLDQLIT